MKPRLMVDHLHWHFSGRVAQLRLARVTFTPAHLRGVVRLSMDVAYVRFFASGCTGYTFVVYEKPVADTALRWRSAECPYGDEAAHEKVKAAALLVIEERFQAHLAARALMGYSSWTESEESDFQKQCRSACARCPPFVSERLEALKGKHG